MPQPESIRERDTFLRLRHARRRVVRGPIRVVSVSCPMRCEVGYVLSKKMAEAVERNRIRRRCQAALRELGLELPSGSFLISPRLEAGQIPFVQLKAHLLAALQRASS